MLVRASEPVLAVIDTQEKRAPAKQAAARTIRDARNLSRGAEEVSVPILVTEQHPNRLGPTVPEIRSAANARIIPKMLFSCMEKPAFADDLAKLDRRQGVLVGMEAHIPVAQTSASVLEQGDEVLVVSDAAASRTQESEQARLARLSAGDAGAVTTEMVLFGWLGKAGAPAFKAIPPLIR